MKKINISLFVTFALLGACIHAAVSSHIIMNPSKSPELPSGAFWIDNHWRKNPQTTQAEPFRWRSTSHNFSNSNENKPEVSLKGLSHLFISGSANPTEANMMWLKKNYGSRHQVFIIDLRQETHLFINGLPISIFYKKDEINWGKTLTEINKTEQNWVNYLSIKGTVQINNLGRPISGIKVPTNPVTVSIKNTHTEKEISQLSGLEYFRIPVPDYHPPSPEQVDHYLTLFKKLPAKAWLHYHCAAGKGRTTTFMVMHDILANGTQVSLSDIVTRQSRLGGINLFEPSESLSTQPWKNEYHRARIDFIKLFYTFVHKGIYPNQSFTQWINNQPDGPYKSILSTAAYP
ncbi:fused DSP-PTPase phosphatase/NAD kinase-like protein [Legionella quateirensis]|uniref:Tyrosine phosphatase II superfamily protein n=1 Tax=Legionella quateirensis TaxID=45072 RepID=A0A378KV49_9GAMM|nr:hypothetical protein [Legionella quateirensis]KTD43354.1 tyrosine phosphatase II superfamily protein [Legionella quateirensis]STY18236.1 tyrosine phosphatase II superfamily protein [Legionella quateirensis]